MTTAGPAERRTAVWWLATFWALALASVLYAYANNPPDPALVGTARYGRSSPGEGGRVAAMLLAEAAVSALLLRPWSYRHSWGRALVAAAVFAPWALLHAAVLLHAGPATAVHAMWLAVFVVLLLGAAAVGAAAARGARPAAAGALAADDAGVRYAHPNGTVETIAWGDLGRVAVLTTDEGPCAADAFAALFPAPGRPGGCLIPTAAPGFAEALLPRLQALPGFDNGAFVAAMGSTANAEFVCWRRGGAPERADAAPTGSA